jgi:putative flavoprotein involved in K+ transport
MSNSSTQTERSPAASRERHDVIVIGAGQAGLAVGYHLRRRGLDFVILDGADRIGDAWRRRWDSLRLFSPAKLDGLPGLRFPAPGNSFPTKDAMADYLESYAAHFALPVRTRTRVVRLSRLGRGYRVETTAGTFDADQVVVAMASYQKRRVPDFAVGLAPDVVQLHASEYRNPAQLRDGAVLIVGAGNSGAEIAVELAGRHRIWMSGRDTGQVPFRIDGLPARLFLYRLILRVLFHRIFTVSTPIGRKMRPKVLGRGAPLIRTRRAVLASAGVERVARTVGLRDGRPVLEDGRALDVANVIWCTGFDPGFSWIDLEIFDGGGEPRHASGVVEEAPGLYFVGLHFLHAFSSGMIHGVSRDAARIAGAAHAHADRAARVAGSSASASAIRRRDSSVRAAGQ